MSAEADDDNLSYSNCHRALLQHFLASQTLTFERAKPVLAAIQTAHTPARPTLPEDIAAEDFEAYIHTLNDTISPFDLEIRSQFHQRTRERVYALVNTTSDALTQMSTSRSADEIAFLKRMLDFMFETVNTWRAEVMAVTSMQALRLAKVPAVEGRREADGAMAGTQGGTQHAGLTTTQADRVLHALRNEGWLERSKNGFYSLSPRALMELKGWLVDTYNTHGDAEDDDDDDEGHEKIKFCQACREIVTVGQRCPDLRCEARIHDYCVNNIFRAQGGRKECPICKIGWQDAPFVGERAARSTQQHRASNGTLVNVRRRATDEHEESDAESDVTD
nr:non-structural maintenance of chromosomes element 1 like [Quercus suber]